MDTRTTRVDRLRGISKTPRRAKSEPLVSHMASREGGADTSAEFRCAPGVVSGEHCLVWVEVAVSFVQAAAQYGTEDMLNKSDGDVAGLLKFIRQASVQDMNKPELLGVVFDGCEGTRVPMGDEIFTVDLPEGELADLDTEMRAEFDERIEALPKSVFT